MNGINQWLLKLAPTSLRLLASTAYFRTWIISGRLKNGESNLTILYGGAISHLDFIRRLLFSGKVESRSLGRQFAWKVRSGYKHLGVELAFIPGHERLLRFAREKNRFFLPWWVTGECDATIDFSAPRWRKRLSGELRRIRKYRYEYRVSRSPQDVEEYHRSMYLPLIKRVHGDSALPMSLREMLGYVRRDGELLLTLRDGEWLAGMIVAYEGDRALARSIGVSGGSRELVKQGVIAAATMNTFRHVASMGYKVLHRGGSRPFLNDGLLTNKRRWGMCLTGHDKCGHFLEIPVCSSGAREFLQNNPFIHVNDGQRWGAVFADDVSRRAQAPDERVAGLAIHGLAGVRVHGFDELYREGTGPEVERLFECR
jgi:hypothetical protein